MLKGEPTADLILLILHLERSYYPRAIAPQDKDSSPAFISYFAKICITHTSKMWYSKPVVLSVFAKTRSKIYLLILTLKTV